MILRGNRIFTESSTLKGQNVFVSVHSLSTNKIIDSRRGRLLSAKNNIIEVEGYAPLTVDLDNTDVMMSKDN